MNILLSLLTGITAAIVHVLSGPDHLAAVTPIVFDSQKRHWQIGFFWGTGHITGMLFIGLLFYWFKDYIPVEKISIHGEQLVGVILIGIGLWSFYRIKHDRKQHTHPHQHAENGKTFVHIHDHTHDTLSGGHQHTHVKTVRQNNTMALLVGIIHGFAGISHFLLMLPVLGYETEAESALYIGGFGIGIITAMVLYTIIIGKLNKMKLFNKSNHLLRNLRFYGGLAAVLVGIYWLGSSLLF